MRLPNNLIHRLREIIHIVRIQPRHRNAPILRHIHVRHLSQLQHLFLAQARETEHANLLRDMLPATRRAHLLQLLPQRLPHIFYPPAHCPQVRLPFGEELLVIQHQRRDACAVGWGVADLAALEDGELRADAGDGVDGVRALARDEVEAARALAVEAEVLGEALRDTEFEALLDEVADGPGVVFEVA